MGSDSGSVGQALYSAGEVRFLLSLSQKEAVDLDADPPDSCAHLTTDSVPAGNAGDDVELLVIARWWDVRRARERVVRAREEQALLAAHALGLSQRQIADAVDVSPATVNRRLRSTMNALLAELGVPDAAAELDRERRTVERALTRVTRPDRAAA